MTFEQAREAYTSDEEMARVLFDALRLQELKLQKHEQRSANQAITKRRENRE